MTLPRLELMAAVLMAKLVVFVKSALKLAPNIRYTCWTDSEIVLHWIRGEPNKWKQFVSDRNTGADRSCQLETLPRNEQSYGSFDKRIKGQGNGEFIAVEEWTRIAEELS